MKKSFVNLFFKESNERSQRNDCELIDFSSSSQSSCLKGEREGKTIPRHHIPLAYRTRTRGGAVLTIWPIPAADSLINVALNDCRIQIKNF